jgi:hypothetical protein
MAAIAWTDVVDVAPTMSTAAAGLQTMVLAYVNEHGVNINAFDGEDGATTKLARAHLAAHLAAMSGRAGVASGPVTSQSAGGLSRSFSVWSGTSMLSSTGYGRLFLMLARAGAGGAALL